jgi:hypothetical protein
VCLWHNSDQAINSVQQVDFLKQASKICNNEKATARKPCGCALSMTALGWLRETAPFFLLHVADPPTPIDQKEVVWLLNMRTKPFTLFYFSYRDGCYPSTSRGYRSCTTASTNRTSMNICDSQAKTCPQVKKEVVPECLGLTLENELGLRLKSHSLE